ncbi:MAG: DUF1800 family protein [Reichenbachiella sp.]
MPLTPLVGPLGIKRAAHLLRRTCTSASIPEIENFATLTAQEAIHLLIQENLPTPNPPIDPATGEEWITNGPVEDVNSDNLMDLLNRWMVGQMFAPGVDESQKLSVAFRERIIFFFHTHFTTKKEKVQDTQAIFYQNALFRFYAFDRDDIEIPVENPDPESEEVLPPIIYPVNFKQLTKKVSVENAMLIFLDGRQNVSGSPNENYGRELLELYAIGRGLEGTNLQGDFEGDYVNYTEQDVQAAARVLSGFDVDSSYSNIDEETGIPRGVIRGGATATHHDNSSKQFSARMNNHVIEGDSELMQGSSATEESVIDEIGQLVDLIYDNPETSRYICRKIYRFFCYHEVDENIQNGIIQDLADVFTSNDFKLTPVFEALFTSQEFYEGAAGKTDDFFGSIIKSPLDLTIGFFRNFNISIPNYETEATMFYDVIGGILSSMRSQGMNYYEPFEVAGYSAFHQYPIFNRSWITTNYLTNRYNFINGKFVPGEMVDMYDVNPYLFVTSNIPDSTARNAQDLITSLAGYFLPLSENLDFAGSATSELTEERLTYFMSSLLSDMDVNPEEAWTANWDSSDRDIDKIDNQLTGLFNAMLQSPEYQLM